MLYALCGVSGSGKTTLLEAVLQRMPHLARLVTFTTRQPRPGEVPGCAYHFVAEASFHAAVATGDLVCPIQYRSYWYATAQADLRACGQTNAMAVLRPDKFACLALYTPMTTMYVELIGQEQPTHGEEQLIVAYKQTCQHLILNIPGHLDQAVNALLTIVRSAK